MKKQVGIDLSDLTTLETIVTAAGRQIPPLWPLTAQVAVNPYLGQAHERLAEAGARLGRTGGGTTSMPRQWYLQRLDTGKITDTDLAEALAASPYDSRPADVEALKDAARQPRPEPRPLPTVADLSITASGIDWPGVIADRVGNWASSYFDAGQALWVAPQDRPAWTAYRMHATHDITAEIIGLKGFAAFVADAHASPLDAIARAVRRLGLDEASLETYFHRLLLSLGGWSQLARYRLWRAELAAGEDSSLIDMLAIRLLWEEALYTRFEKDIAETWAETREALATPVVPGKADIIDEIMQEAAERANQRSLADTLAEPAYSTRATRPRLQAAFCIDVRSEIFRRALERVDPSIRTLGFAGFFGMFTSHRRFASDVEEMRLPVLLNPVYGSCATAPEAAKADTDSRLAARALRAWGRFKLAAVSCFAFVEAMGPVYAAKLLRDALGLKPTPVPNDPKPRFEPELDLPARIGAAETVLRAMSLTDGFAPVVLLVGHGANVVNNPHASGLHCGACGGYSGEVNSRLLAGLLNDRQVRAGLAERGIRIPDDTLFVAGLHDTTTDAVALYARDTDTSKHAADLREIRVWLDAAGTMTRAERALRLPRAAHGDDVPGRARNWAEVRPEWALAGCRAFIAAPRARTAGRDLGGRAFLHDYDWEPDRDNGFPVLELIMTAPVVVASWISLQYYGSTVAPDAFGSGNKLLHNVVGGIGVVEGNGGNLRGGLPWQSVHDGEDYVHEPLRLSVCIEAPRDALTDILRRHDEVRELFDNRWLHLFTLDEAGRMALRYAGGLAWTAVGATVDDKPLRAAS
jgi:hypothetical protein